MRNLALFTALLLFSGVVNAQVNINYNEGLYALSPNLNNVGQGSTLAERAAAAQVAIGIYRSKEGPLSLRRDTVVNITYDDGAKEQCIVKGTVASTNCELKPGSFQPAPGQSTGFGSSGFGWYLWTGTVWTFSGMGQVYYGEVGEVTPVDPGEDDPR